MKLQLQQALSEVLKKMGVSDVVPDVVISENAQHGEYATNIAMKLAKQLKQSPMEIGMRIKNALEKKIADVTISDDNAKTSSKNAGNESIHAIEKIEVVVPGFVNFYVTEAKLSTSINSVLMHKDGFGTSKTLVPLQLDESVTPNPKRILVEFAHPNTHKAFHIGHLRNITTAESLIRLLEATGHKVIRANYQGDVGMHIAKCLYALTKLTAISSQLTEIRKNTIHEKVTFLGKAYAAGSSAFEENDEAKNTIGSINKQIYAKDPEIYPLYQETRQWSLDYFSSIYKRVGSHYDRLYFESETYGPGKEYVLAGVKNKIFEESQGAIIFPGEKYGLHNRVFITREGNATYEGKDMGLAPLQHTEYHPDLIMHVLGPEQYSYTRVIFKAMDLLFPETANRQFHKTYGWVKLKDGKMSSRLGNVVLGEWLLDEAKTSIYEILKQNESKYSDIEKEEIAEKGAIAAVKYAFLRVSTDQEISFDIKESVSFDGDSGPYLLYTYARARSVLRKAQAVQGLALHKMNLEEKALARALFFFPEIVEKAAAELSPNMVCTYLFQLAQAFNVFYQKHSIIGDKYRENLTAATAQVLKNGLYLLGISTVERM